MMRCVLLVCALCVWCAGGCAAAGGGEAAVGAAQTQHTSNVPGDQVPKKIVLGMRYSELMKKAAPQISAKQNYTEEGITVAPGTPEDAEKARKPTSSWAQRGLKSKPEKKVEEVTEVKKSEVEDQRSHTENLSVAETQHTETAPREQEHVADRVAAPLQEKEEAHHLKETKLNEQTGKEASSSSSSSIKPEEEVKSQQEAPKAETVSNTDPHKDVQSTAPQQHSNKENNPRAVSVPAKDIETSSPVAADPAPAPVPEKERNTAAVSEATNSNPATTAAAPEVENVKDTKNADSSVSPVWVHAPLLLLTLFAVTAV
ncbi:hypothetical protein DQ04_04521010 [Trypanosoma grayi]|uniref:hypothetical protein n=1 Tax=Trypanosoma grayi TaxID=71804 RepID=UPI0004F47ADA|nr:hypothetical protein DQ04_04521010 [Trypanosoma grayi]KEG09860.1 hypothetical protein DQ04_04521010 [Trypanosoma grayi]